MKMAHLESELEVLAGLDVFRSGDLGNFGHKSRTKEEEGEQGSETSKVHRRKEEEK